MRRARTKTEHISVLAKCSSVVLLLLLASPAYSLSISGLPAWLEGAVARSISAVWQEIPDTPETDREGTLELVAARLFAGYSVFVYPGRRGPAVIFSAHDEPSSLRVNIQPPDLRGMSAEWFREDTTGLSGDVASLLGGVPKTALTWADEALREQIGRLVSARLPGWEFAQHIYISSEEVLITLTFRPSTKLVLAVKPSLYSRTIPVMFRSDLEAKLLPFFSPLIGVPVKWAAKHKADIEAEAREFLLDRHAVENLKAGVSVKFRADTVSELDAEADSEDFTFSMWVAAYAGLEGKYPEAGLFFGFRPGWRAELYTELLFSLNDFEVTRRIGVRFEALDNLFIGIDAQWPEDSIYLRVQYIPAKVRRPYALWRWSPELREHEAALGYRIDEHVSIELYYNSTGSDKVGIRGQWQL